MRRILELLHIDNAGLDLQLNRSGHNLPSLGEPANVFRSAGLPVTLARRDPPLPSDTAPAMIVYRNVGLSRSH